MARKRRFSLRNLAAVLLAILTGILVGVLLTLLVDALIWVAIPLLTG